MKGLEFKRRNERGEGKMKTDPILFETGSVAMENQGAVEAGTSVLIGPLETFASER